MSVAEPQVACLVVGCPAGDGGVLRPALEQLAEDGRELFSLLGGEGSEELPLRLVVLKGAFAPSHLPGLGNGHDDAALVRRVVPTPDGTAALELPQTLAKRPPLDVKLREDVLLGHLVALGVGQKGKDAQLAESDAMPTGMTHAATDDSSDAENERREIDALVGGVLILVVRIHGDYFFHDDTPYKMIVFPWLFGR